MAMAGQPPLPVVVLVSLAMVAFHALLLATLD